MKIGFKVFQAQSARELEGILNEWAKSLPDKIKIRRTQLSANNVYIYALVNYEELDKNHV